MGFENGRLVRVALEAVHAASAAVEVNTLHYDLDDSQPGEPNDPQSLADTFRDDVIPSFKAMYTNAWNVQQVTVTEELDPQNPTNPRQQWVSGAVVAGTRTITSDPLPRGICGCAQLKTAHIGRRFRGRMFLGGGLGEGDQNGESFSTGTTILALWTTFLGNIPRQPDISPPLSDSTAKWCVYSRTQRAANLDPYASAITTVNLLTKIHWLRSRERP